MEHDSNKKNNVSPTGSTPDNTSSFTDGATREGIILSTEQQEALAGLTSTNTYAKQSKWQTFRELPLKDKLPFFVQHFLPAAVVAFIAVVMVVVFVYEYVTKDPDPLLSVAGINLSSDISEQMEELEEDFADASGLDAELMSYDGNFQLTESGTANGSVDSSARLLTQTSVGSINTIITDEDTMQMICERGLITSLEDVLDADQFNELQEAGVVVEITVTDDDEGDVVYTALDLSRSNTWTSIDGMPSDTLLAFGNTEESGANYPQAFIDYLDFS